MTPKKLQILPKPVRCVEILAFPAVQLLDVAGPLQVFCTANELAVAAGQPMPYRTEVVAPASGTVQASAGLGLAAAPLPPADASVDTLMIAGGQGVLAAADDAALIAWVATHAVSARRVASVCTGAFLLAAAGLLDNRRAVTHWMYCGDLARKHPAIRVDPDPIFVRDGKVWTSAGVTAGIDLALALVEDDLGREAALAVARHLVVFLKRPGGQAQFSSALALQSAGDRFAELNAWIAAHLREDLSVQRLAREAKMSDRSFMRRYLEATGLTPARAVERLRTEAARQLLADTRLPLKQVASRCGFGTEDTMRRTFQRLQGIRPQDFRARFGR